MICNCPYTTRSFCFRGIMIQCVLERFDGKIGMLFSGYAVADLCFSSSFQPHQPWKIRKITDFYSCMLMYVFLCDLILLCFIVRAVIAQSV
jgi:hypothetical protein